MVYRTCMSRTNVDIDDDARKLRGSGWEGDLDELRADRADAAVLHRDSDFDTLARHAGLIVDRQR